MNFKNLSLILFIICMVAVFWLSLVPEPPEIPLKMTAIDKIEHFAAYAVMAFLFRFYLSYSRIRRSRSILIVIVVMLFTGGLIEILQGYTGRQPEAADLLADAAGAAAGSLISLFLQR